MKINQSLNARCINNRIRGNGDRTLDLPIEYSTQYRKTIGQRRVGKHSTVEVDTVKKHDAHTHYRVVRLNVSVYGVFIL